MTGPVLADVKLTDYQERTLIALVDLARSERPERLWHRLTQVQDRTLKVFGVRHPTAARLARLGLIEFKPTIRFRHSPSVRATDAGIALCDSMGD